MNLYLPVYQWNVEKVLLQNNDQMLRNREYKEWSLFQCVFVCVPVECRKVFLQNSDQTLRSREYKEFVCTSGMQKKFFYKMMIRHSEAESIKRGFDIDTYLPVCQWNVEKVFLQSDHQIFRPQNIKQGFDINSYLPVCQLDIEKVSQTHRKSNEDLISFKNAPLCRCRSLYWHTTGVLEQSYGDTLYIYYLLFITTLKQNNFSYQM